MLRQNRTFRVFVSSTFSDLKAERNVLQEKVFPELQKLCEANGCRFQAIDLRWGVSEEAALDQQTMNICLTELKRCQDVTPRPNFIILLGDRYGWIPLPPQIEASEFEAILSQITDDVERQLLDDWYRLDTNAVPSEYVLRPRRQDVFEEVDYASWTKIEEKLREILVSVFDKLGWPEDDPRRIKYECSATHQEILDGAMKLPDEREHVFAFFRNTESFDDRLDALKLTIRGTKGVTVFEYGAKSLNVLANDAYESLSRVIQEEIGKLEELDLTTRENIAHKEFGAGRCRHFVGRQTILDDIAAYISEDDRTPLVVYGPSGCGKSALMAKAAQDTAGKHKDAYIIQRFVGATPESTDIRTLLANLCLEVTQAYRGDADTIPTEYKDLKEELPKRLELATPDEPLILFLDALDQLSTSDNAHSLNWLPKDLPANVKIVVSVLEREDDTGQCLRSARSKQLPLVSLGGMTPSEGAEALGVWLSEAKRTLRDEQMESVLSGFRECPMPLYMKLAFEEARRWKSYDGLPCSADDVPGLASDIEGIVQDMLAQLKDKRNHGEVLVETFLGLLSAARHGLSETEILELLSDDEEVMADLRARSRRSPEASGIPAVVWLRLYHDLAPYLIERSADNTVLLNFYHRQVEGIIRQDYSHIKHHTRLAHYFQDKPLWTVDSEEKRVPNHRKCAELPFQLTEAELWNELVATLTDLDFVDAKSRAGLVYDLVADYRAALGAELLPAESRESIQPFARFLRSRAHVLIVCPEIVLQEAFNYMSSGPVAQCAETILKNPGRSRPWLRLENRPESPPDPSQLHSLEGHLDRVDELAVTPDGRRAVTGSRDQTVKVWDLMTGACLQSFDEHTGEVTAVAVTPDGRRVVSGQGIGPDALQGTIIVWDLASGARLWTLDGHKGGVKSVAVSSDSRYAVSIGQLDSIGKVWDLSTGVCTSTIEADADEFEWIAGTHSDCRVVSVEGNGKVRLWDLALGEYVQACRLQHSLRRTCAIALTADDRGLVTVAEVARGLRRETVVEIWDLSTGGLVTCFENHVGHVEMAVLSDDGRRLVTVGWGDIALWNLANCKRLGYLGGQGRDVIAAAIAPNGGLLLTAGEDGSVTVWDLTVSEYILELDGHPGGTVAVALTRDGTRLLTGGRDCTAKLWDAQDGACLRTLKGHRGEVLAVAASPAGDISMTGSADKTVKVWDTATGKCLRTLRGHKGDVTVVVPFAEGSRAVTGGLDGVLKVWDISTGVCLRTLLAHESGIWAMAITPDESKILTGGESPDNTVKVWDLETGECLRTMAGHAGLVTALIVIPDTDLVITAGGDSQIHLCDWMTGRHTQSMSGLGDWAWSIALLQGERMITATLGGTICLWDLATGRRLGARQLPSEIRAIAVTLDSRKLVIVGSGPGAAIIDLANPTSLLPMGRVDVGARDILGRSTGGYRIEWAGKTSDVYNKATRAYLRTLDGHTSDVRFLVAMPDGRHAVSVCNAYSYYNEAYGEIRAWDLANGACLWAREAHWGEVALAVTPDGCQAVTGGASRDNGTARIKFWDLETGACVAALTVSGGSPTAIAITPDRRHVIAGYAEGLVAVWHIGTGACLWQALGHRGPVFACGVTSDGLRATTGGEDGHVKTWDLAVGACLSEVYTGSTVSAVAAAQKRYAVTGGSKRFNNGHLHAVCPASAEVWDLEEGKRIAELPEPVRLAAVTTDGRLAATAGENSVSVWDPATGYCRRTFPGGAGEIGTIAISADGKCVVSTDEKPGGLVAWDVDSATCLWRVDGGTDPARAVAITLDGRYGVATCSGGIGVWDLDSGVRTGVFRHDARVSAVGLRQDGTRAITGGTDGVMRVWDLNSGQCIREYEGFPDDITAVAMTPEGGRIAVASGIQISLIDANSGKHTGTLETHRYGSWGSIWGLALTSDGRVVSVSRDGAISFHDADRGGCLETMEWRPRKVTAFGITPDGRQLVVSRNKYYYTQIELRDLETGEVRNHYLHSEMSCRVCGIAVSGDGRRLITSNGDGEVKEWELNRGGVCSSKPLSRHASAITSAALSPDRRVVVCGSRCREFSSNYREIILWDLATSGCVGMLDGRGARVTALAVTPDCRRVLLAGDYPDCSLSIWEADAGECRVALDRHTGPLTGLAATPDGLRAVTVSQDGKIKVWDVSTGVCAGTLDALLGPLTCLALTPDGVSALVGSKDGTVDMWDVGAGVRIRTLHAHLRNVTSLAVSPDGLRIATGSDDRTLRIWDLTTGEELACHVAQAGIDGIAVSPTGQYAVRDSAGAEYTLVLENVVSSPTIVTAFGLDTDDTAAFRCLHCDAWTEVSKTALGTTMLCPDCREAVKLNPFAVVTDWRLISAAWRGRTETDV